MDTLIHSANRLDTLFRVLQRIVFIGMLVVLCVMVVLTVVNRIDPGAVIGEDFHLIDLGPVTLELAEEHTPDNRTVLGYAWIYVAVAVVWAAVIYYCLHLIRKVLEPMKSGDPFHSSVSLNIRKMAWASLVLGIVKNVGSAVELSTALRHFGLDGLAESGIVRSIRVNYTADLSFLVLFFVLLLMSWIFRYGTQLQQLSDETL